MAQRSMHLFLMWKIVIKPRQRSPSNPSVETDTQLPQVRGNEITRGVVATTSTSSVPSHQGKYGHLTQYPPGVSTP